MRNCRETFCISKHWLQVRMARRYCANQPRAITRFILGSRLQSDFWTVGAPQYSNLHMLHEDVVIIFHRPHSYISPILYEIRKSVQTWNYAAIHVYGKGRVITDESATRQVRNDLITQFDSSYIQQWNSVSDEYH